MTNEKEARRKKRVRSRIKGTQERPRLSVYRSNRYISAQLIDDVAGETLLGIHEKSLSDLAGKTKTERAEVVGRQLAEQALETGIKTVVFDRGGYRFHGRIKALAEAAREEGLRF